MDVKDMAKMGGEARWKGKTAEEKSKHGKKMAEEKKRKNNGQKNLPPEVL